MIWTFIKVHKNTHNPPGSFPDAPIYCTLSEVETSILTPPPFFIIIIIIITQNKLFISEKRGCFYSTFHNFGIFFWPFLAFFCLILHSTSQNIKKKTRKKTLRMTASVVQKWFKNGSKRPQNDTKTMPK